MQHAGQDHVHAEHRLAHDLVRNVEALHRLAGDLPLLRVAQRNVLRRLQLGGLCCHLAVTQTSLARCVADDASLDGTFGRRHTPARRRRVGQHHPCGGAGLAHVVLRAAHALAAAGRHRAPDAFAADMLVGRGEFGTDLGPVAVQFFGHQLGQRRIGALAHFGPGNAHHHAVIGMDHHPRIDFGDRQALGSHCRQREGKFERQSATQRYGCLDEFATIDFHGIPLRLSSRQTSSVSPRPREWPREPGYRFRSGRGWSSPDRYRHRLAWAWSPAKRRPT